MFSIGHRYIQLINVLILVALKSHKIQKQKELSYLMFALAFLSKHLSRKGGKRLLSIKERH